MVCISLQNWEEKTIYKKLSPFDIKSSTVIKLIGDMDHMYMTLALK